jgi:release factor glutamine methyltransferase
MKTKKYLVLHSVLESCGKRLNSPLEAQLLLSFVLGISRSSLYTRSKEDITTEKYEQFLALVERRETGEPIAYLLGVKEFWSLPFMMTKAVLIPRPETELLVETALQYLPSIDPIDAIQKSEILDLGTGSGAVALALAKERPHCSILGVDKSQAALAVALHNAEYLSLSNVQFCYSDWFSCFHTEKREFDLVVGNPPYISTSEYANLGADLQFEPPEALISGIDGLFDLQAIIQATPQFLKSNGWLMLEHAAHQGLAVKHLMLENGFKEVQVLQDLAGLDRITIGQKTDVIPTLCQISDS